MKRGAPLPVVHVMATGGTIANTTQGRINVSRVAQSLPELKRIAKIEVEELVRVNSNSLTLDHWLQMAKRINAVLRMREVRGVVVTHGSNTLEETTYFLNLTVESERPDWVSGDTLNPQKARILLMLALTRTRKREVIQRMFNETNGQLNEGKNADA